ncbi:flavin reductase family protein [Arthrobacter agilis]|uniref:flavin reductase family protein n=1 Tax=Arthrobacter agilis TaxID=37921 RepID=UPI000B356608|nr:flavin reductase family protein [Arthrobacter agilis]OUM45486.1 flavin reductase [Arthrobacter agilis]PPB47702.1 flavin reductase family protein [Arthrobacter agilis]TPV26567.1 flavin reductase family protein [Arthrobacter agilis]VDR33519.1 Flavoredoxin [Arthrobacter agilis]
MRRNVSPDPTSSRAFYSFLTSVVVPRPIAWVSSTSADGVDNLAPHSFFTIASVNPPIVQFTSVGRKDSVRNIEATGEFVVNFTPEDLFEAVNATGTDFPPDVSEFDAAGLTREPSATVGPPRVLESPVALECRLHLLQDMGNCTLVFGEVIHAVVSEEMLDGDLPAIDALKPLSRLGRNEWGTAGTIRDITRIPFRDWPGHYDAAEPAS